MSKDYLTIEYEKTLLCMAIGSKILNIKDHEIENVRQEIIRRIQQRNEIYE